MRSLVHVSTARHGVSYFDGFTPYQLYPLNFSFRANLHPLSQLLRPQCLRFHLRQENCLL